MKHFNLRLKLLFLTVFAGVNFSAMAQGEPELQPFAWNGSVSSDWDDPNNWTPNIVPVITSEITISITGNAPTFTGVKTVENVIINSGASLTIPVGATLNITGDLDMYSESNSYASLIVNGTIAITGTAKYHRFTNSQSNGNDLIAPPLAGQTWSSFLTSDANYNEGVIFNNGVQPTTTYLFGPFEKGATDDYLLYDDNSTEVLVTGRGYRAATNTGTGATLTFTGSVVTGPVVAPIQSDSSGQYSEWNLIGNPYPAYIDVEAFLTHVGSVSELPNMTLFDESTAAIYGYNAETVDPGNKWTVLNLATGSTLIAPGQGFFVSSSYPISSLEFTPDMQVAGNADDFILGRQEDEPNDFAKIKMQSVTNDWSTSVYFHESASNGLDIGYDACIYGNSIPDFCLYTHLLDDNEDLPFAIQTLNTNVSNNVTVPLGVNASQGEQITFSLEDSYLPEEIEVYLEDTITGTSTLLNTLDYTITTTSSISGTGRFFLHFATDGTLSLDETNLNNLNDLNVYSNPTNRTILVEGALQSETNASVYDIHGRKVLQSKMDTSINRNVIMANELSSGVYVVQLQNDYQEITQKVILK